MTDLNTDFSSHYGTLKSLHQTVVGLSLTLFAARWLGVLTHATWPMRPLARWGSVAIDTLLLSAGLGLWWLGGWHLGQSPWLATKLVLLLVYIVLGSWALKRARSGLGRGLFGLVALAVAGWMAGVALAHHPAGWWLWWR